jgi:hypothetical protein
VIARRLKRENYHLRELKSVPYHEGVVSPEFEAFARQHLLPGIPVAGRKLAHKNAVAVQILHNLALAGIAGKVVVDTRRKQVAGVRLRTEIWDAIVEAKLATMCRGRLTSPELGSDVFASMKR